MKPLKTTLAIIPARAGSKRLPGKNIKELAGKPLVGWTVEQACRCKYFTEVIISTDCPTIADIAKRHGAKAPFLRPISLAADNSSSMDLVDHALDYYASQGQTFDYIALLEPTSPLRKKEDLDNAMSALLMQDNYHALISVGKIEREHPSILKHITPEKRLSYYFKEASKHEAYFPYGVLYVSKVSTLRETRTFYQVETLPYLIDRWQNFEIDDEVDFWCTEKLVEKYGHLL